MAQVGIVVEGQEGLTWERWRHVVADCERLGFASLCISDHLQSVPHRRAYAPSCPRGRRFTWRRMNPEHRAGHDSEPGDLLRAGGTAPGGGGGRSALGRTPSARTRGQAASPPNMTASRSHMGTGPTGSTVWSTRSY